LYIFSVVILVVIVVTFVGAPLISRTGQRGSVSFGSYKGQPIEYYPGNYFSRQKDIIAEQVRQEGETDNLETQAYKVWRNAFDQTVFHTALLLEAEQDKLWVTEDRIDKALIASGPYLVDGEFDEEKYRNTSKAERFSTRKLFKEQIIHEQYIRDVLGSQKLSPKEAQFFRQMAEAQRSFSFIHYSFSEFPQKEILDYGTENKKRFRKIKLSRILIKASEKETVEIRKKLDERISSFEELARAHSKDLYAEKGGNMSWRYFYDLEGDFDSSEPVERIFGLNEGELSAVLESRFGWVIYRADSQAVDLDMSDEQTLQIVKDYVMRYEKGMVEDYFQEKALEFKSLAERIGFYPACTALGIIASRTSYFPLNYQGIFYMAPVKAQDEGTDITSASFSQEFFETAFSLVPDQISDPVLLDDQVLILVLNDIRRAPDREAELMEDFYRYLAYQTLQMDLQEVLMDPENLEDNFNSIFYQYIIPRQ